MINHAHIKNYIKQYHDRGQKPTIRQIAEAFGITPDEVRAALKRIRGDREPDIIKDILGLFRK